MAVVDLHRVLPSIVIHIFAVSKHPVADLEEVLRLFVAVMVASLSRCALAVGRLGVGKLGVRGWGLGVGGWGLGFQEFSVGDSWLLMAEVIAILEFVDRVRDCRLN
jgi:hypothetical protein